MKRKTIIISIITCLLLTTILMCGCNPVDTALKKVDKSLASAASLKSVIAVSDNGVAVYSLEKTVTVEGDNVTVVTDEASLGNDFVLEHSVSTTTLSKDGQMVLPLAVNKDNVASYEDGKNTLTCVISKDEFAAMLNSETLVSNGDVTIVFSFADNKLQQMNCTYSTETQKTVSISVTCSY